MNADEHRSEWRDRRGRAVDVERLNRLTELVIGCAYRVSNVLGCGHFEKVYENAMRIELRKAGLEVAQQPSIDVLYDGVVVGEYFADLIVEDLVLVELKAVRELDSLNTAQCLNYLVVTGLPVCLLINFGQPKIQVRRFMGKHGVRP